MLVQKLFDVHVSILDAFLDENIVDVFVLGVIDQRSLVIPF